MEEQKQEQHIYKIGKINFIVTPVYRQPGETLHDILLKSCCRNNGHT